MSPFRPRDQDQGGNGINTAHPESEAIKILLLDWLLAYPIHIVSQQGLI